MVFACLRTGFEKLFGVKNWLKMHSKTMCKTCLNLEAIFDEFGLHFGSLFRLRLAGPGQNFRFRSGSCLGLWFGCAQEAPQAWFLEVLGRSMTCFGGIFAGIKSLCWSMFWKFSGRSPVLKWGKFSRRYQLLFWSYLMLARVIQEYDSKPSWHVVHIL